MLFFYSVFAVRMMRCDFSFHVGDIIIIRKNEIMVIVDPKCKNASYKPYENISFDLYNKIQLLKELK